MRLAYPQELLTSLPISQFRLWRYSGWTFTGQWIAQGYHPDSYPLPEAYTSWALDVILKTEPINYRPLQLTRNKATGFYQAKSSFAKDKVFIIHESLGPLLTHHLDSHIYPIYLQGPSTGSQGIWCIGIFAEVLGTEDTVQEQENVRKTQRLRAIVIPSKEIHY